MKEKLKEVKLKEVKRGKGVNRLNIDNPVFKQAIDHFKKMVECEKFIITGSYALAKFGLTHSIKDLDIVLIKPAEESLQILEKLRITESENNHYPIDKSRIPVMFGDLKIDFIIRSSRKYIELADGLLIAYPMDIIEAKQRYQKTHHILQIKAIADRIFTPKMLSDSLSMDFKRLFGDDSINIKESDVIYIKESDVI